MPISVIVFFLINNSTMNNPFKNFGRPVDLGDVRYVGPDDVDETTGGTIPKERFFALGKNRRLDENACHIGEGRAQEIVAAVRGVLNDEDVSGFKLREGDSFDYFKEMLEVADELLGTNFAGEVQQEILERVYALALPTFNSLSSDELERFKQLIAGAVEQRHHYASVKYDGKIYKIGIDSEWRQSCMIYVYNIRDEQNRYVMGFNANVESGKTFVDAKTAINRTEILRLRQFIAGATPVNET